MAQKHEYVVLELLQDMGRNLKAQPLNLGGLGGGGGGVGAPPAGFIGRLPQWAVAYDTTEAATLDTLPSGVAGASGWSLVDNLNHIRYRIEQLEIGSGVLVVQEADGSPIVVGVDKIIFSGAVVTDLGSGDVLVTISGGGGGLDTAAGDARYLKLNASNDPVTGRLQIQPTALALGENEAVSIISPGGQALYLESLSSTDTIFAEVHNAAFATANIESTSGIVVTDPVLGFYRYATHPSGEFSEAVFYIEDYQDNATFNRGSLRHIYNPTGIDPNILLTEINPYASGDETAIYFDTLDPITASGKLVLIKNNSVEKFSVNGSGVVDIAAGATYNIGGVPHTHSGSTSLTVESFGGGTIVNNVDKISIYGAIVADAGSGDVLVLMNDPESVVPDSVRTKYIITPSISSNNLTLAIKYINGNDCNVTNRIIFRVGNTDYTLNTSASFTKNAGTNWCNAGNAMFAAKDVDYFVYAIGETGASSGLKFGFSRISHAVTMGDFVNTTTNEKYIAGNWTNFNSTDAVTVIGRFRAQLSASASFNWSIPTAKVINYPIYQTDWLTYLPTYSADAPMTFTSVTTTMAIYQIRSLCEEIKFDFNGTTGTGASNGILFSPPIAPSTAIIGTGLAYGTSYVLDGTPSNGYTRIGTALPAGITYIQVLKADETVYGLGASRYARGSIILPI